MSMAIFNSYVKLPEGKLVYNSKNYGFWYANNYSCWGESKPTNITGGPQNCSHPLQELSRSNKPAMHNHSLFHDVRAIVKTTMINIW